MRLSRLWRVLGLSVLLLFFLGGHIWAGVRWLENRSGYLVSLVAGQFRYPARSMVPRVSATPAGSSAWHIAEIDPPRRFQDMEDRSLALDAAGYPHIAYGLDHLYYIYYDGIVWHRETVDGAPSVGRHASLALDGAGQPHIAYCDDDNVAIKYAHYSGSSWQVVTVANTGDAQDFCWHTSLSLDTSDWPHIAYFDWIDLRTKYAHFDGAAWQIQSVGEIGGSNPSLALDGLDHPHLTYTPVGGGLGYTYYNGSTWINTTVDAAQAWEGSSLALDTQGWPHISYGKRYARFDGTTWLTETIPGIFSCSPTSLALDSSGRPHIGCGGGSYFSLTYAHFDGEGWQVETVGDNGEDVSLALDAQGRPHLSSRISIGGDAYMLQYARRDAGWQVETVDQGGGSVGEYNSLALDAAGHPHVSYWDRGNWTLKYAHYDGMAWISETVDSAGYIVSSATSLALDAAGHPHIAYCASWCCDSCAELRYAWHDGSDWVTETVDSGSYVGRDASLALDADDRPHIAYGGYGDLRYTYFDGLGWISTTVDAGGGEFWPGQTSLVLDASGRPHIAYWNEFDLRYAYDDGTGWQLQTVAPMNEGVGISLALDAADRPHIVYQSGGAPYGAWLWYAYDDGLGWSTEMIQSQQASWGSLALDAASRPHIAYSCAVLSYAFREGSTWITETVDSGGGAYTALALDAQNRPHVSYVGYGNALGLRYAWWQCDPLVGVAIGGPGRLPVGITGLYSATYTPFSATLPDLAWSNGVVSPTAVYSWTTVGDHRLAVTATNPCSQAAAPFTVTVFCQPLEGIVITGPVTLSAGEAGIYQSVVTPITASRPITFAWNNGTAAPSAVYSWTISGTYTVSLTATNVCGGVRSASLPVQVLVPSYAFYLPLVLRRQ